jgi:hypothetical protein
MRRRVAIAALRLSEGFIKTPMRRRVAIAAFDFRRGLSKPR